MPHADIHRNPLEADLDTEFLFIGENEAPQRFSVRDNAEQGRVGSVAPTIHIIPPKEQILLPTDGGSCKPEVLSTLTDL